MSRTDELIYLAGPYTHESSKIRSARFESVTRAAAMLIKKGHIVYSPLTMTHPIDVLLAGEQSTLGSDFWVNFDQRFMECCTALVILRLQGWESSAGIKREISFFKTRNLPTSFLDPNGNDIPDVPLP